MIDYKHPCKSTYLYSLPLVCTLLIRLGVFSDSLQLWARKAQMTPVAGPENSKDVNRT